MKAMCEGVLINACSKVASDLRGPWEEDFFSRRKVLPWTVSSGVTEDLDQSCVPWGGGADI